MMYKTMKQIVIKNGRAEQIFAYSTELWDFHDRLGLGLRDDVTALTV